MKGLGFKLFLCVGCLISLLIWNFVVQNINQQTRQKELSLIKNDRLEDLSLLNDIRFELKSINEFYAIAVLLGDTDFLTDSNKKIQPIQNLLKALREKHHQAHQNLIQQVEDYLNKIDPLYRDYINRPENTLISEYVLDLGKDYQKIASDLEQQSKLTQQSLDEALEKFQQASEKSHLISNGIHLISILVLMLFGLYVHAALVKRLKHFLKYLIKLRNDETVPILKDRKDEIGLIENQIIEVQQQLIEAKSTAERASQAKTNFLANMNHELRTPLNGIMGVTEIIQDSELNEEQLQCVDIIDRSSRLLLEIFDDILEMTKLNTGKIPLTPTAIALDEVFKSMVVVLQPELQKKKGAVELITSIDPQLPKLCWIDTKRLNQTLLNLIGNAIRFSDKGKVSVTATLVEQQGDELKVKITIQDEGIGIAPENLSRLFDMFTQADESSTRHHGGTGLGLAISKASIDLMQGRMGAESQLGKGSTFWFEFPTRESKEPL